ncbi:MAG: hypothetical protein RBR16_07335 [Syntrophus sp. (in: bacteria)]|nr:hypothetical protein [Syntrophus sp. (in: bacteria)]
MKSKERKMKRMEERQKEMLRELENRERIWNAAMAGDEKACRFLAKQYLGHENVQVDEAERSA